MNHDPQAERAIESERRMAEALQAAKPAALRGLARVIARALLLSRVRGSDPPKLGRYEIESKLGEGGMGAVFLARDPDLDRRVAIKLARGEEGAALSEQEARALARLAHPNVLAVHDVGMEDGTVWIVTEYVAGRTLRDLLAERPPPGWRGLSRMMADVARGLAAAHAAGIVHADVKPDNILVGDDGRPRVSDFGLALRDASGTARLLGGTPAYLSPELRSGGSPSPQSDQWAFFMTLRELLPARARVSAALGQLIDRGIADSPEGRWPSMSAVARMLDEIAEAPAEADLWRPPPTRSTDLDVDMRTLLELATGCRGHEELRTELLRWLDRTVGFDTALLGRPEVLGPGGPRIVGFEPQFVAQFARDPARYAPALMRLVLASAETGRAVRDVDVYSIAERGELPFYNELIGPKGSRVMVIGTLVASGAVQGSVQISRASRGAVFRDRELRILDRALPVIAHAEAAFGGRRGD